MSKAIFRFLRGELNGFYLKAIYNTLNEYTKKTRDYLACYRQFQFELNPEITNTIFNPLEHIKNIGLVAGVFSPYITQDSNLVSIKFTQSHKVNGIEYSERGLFSSDTGIFNFFHTTEHETEDINTLANKANRSSMVESGAPILGYIAEGDEILDEECNIDYSKILPEPPEGKAYYPFYGEKYLYLSDSAFVRAKIPSRVYAEMIKIFQWVRYNGTSIATLAHLAEVLCPDYLFIFDSIDWTSLYGRGIIEYGVDSEYEAEDKLIFVSLFKLTVKTKFPQVILKEVNIKVTRDSTGKSIYVEKLEE